jgi:hypothetical protein
MIYMFHPMVSYGFPQFLFNISKKTKNKTKPHNNMTPFFFLHGKALNQNWDGHVTGAGWPIVIWITKWCENIEDEGFFEGG